MKFSSYCLASLCLFLPSQKSLRRQAVDDPPYDRSNASFMQHDFDGAEQAAREVVAGDSVAAHRADAALMLASIEWRVRGDTASAAPWLDSAASMKGGATRALTERARMLNGTGRYAAAMRVAREAVDGAADSTDRRAALVQLALGASEPLVLRALSTTPPRLNAQNQVMLRPILARLGAEVAANPGDLAPAKELVMLGALTGDGDAILAGWRSYYTVGVAGAATAVLSKPALVLAKRLPQLKNGVRGAERAAIARALADSRFFDAAAVMAAGAAATRDIVVYARFVRAVERITNEYYRETALKRGNAKQWQGAVDSLFRNLWQELPRAGAAQPYVRDSAEAEIDRRYGAVVNMGSTAGYDDLHMGHRVVDEQRIVRQYGHQTTIRFVSLDAMVSNGFQSWAWDGRAGHGGWGGGESITQVRPGYAMAPRRAWHAIANSARRRELAARESADSAADLMRARATPVAYFAGLSRRLDRQGEGEIVDSLRARGLSGRALESAFIATYDWQLRESSIFAHEGRHVIDGTLGKFSDEDLEFRAKLSEVAFAPYPRLAMGGILSENIGDETPHGKANARVLAGVLQWMTAHESEIRALDRTQPILPQLSLLSDAQLRTAFSSLDPLATPST